jgi:hypothetical protein
LTCCSSRRASRAEKFSRAQSPIAPQTLLDADLVHRHRTQDLAVAVNLNPLGAAPQGVFVALCTRKGGIVESRFCGKAGDCDSVLFMPKVNRSHDSSRRTEIQIEVAERPASPQAPDYMAMLLEAGFETGAARQARLDATLASQPAASRQQQEKADAERRRLAAELPQMKRRGTQICRDDGLTTWVGLVEDEANGKRKILLNRGYVTRTPSMGVTMPSSNLVREFPDRWRLCPSTVTARAASARELACRRDGVRLSTTAIARSSSLA